MENVPSSLYKVFEVLDTQNQKKKKNRKSVKENSNKMKENMEEGRKEEIADWMIMG